MKTNYFLEFSRDKTPTVAFLILYLSLLLITGINTMTIIYFWILLFLAFYFKMQDKFAGLYITKADITYKRVFLKKKIDINFIDCIRLQPEWTQFWGMHKILRDENGNILFRMRFYHNYYEKDELDGYDFIEEIKRFFVERQICHCIYDKEALDYLLTLNPNIKVVYYDQK